VAIRVRTLIAVASSIGILALVGCAASGDARASVDGSQLIGVWGVDQTFTGPEQPYISFTDNGNWTSSDGCNTVAGTWELGELGAITTTAGPSTLIACDGAPLPQAMADALFVQVDGNYLTITGSQEPATTDLIRSTDPLVGPQGPPTGVWAESAGDNAPYLEFAADGSFSGKDGCNNIFGSWSVAGDGSIKFSGVGSTLMACMGVDQWLSMAATANVKAGVMTIFGAEGLVLGQLTQL